MTYTVDIEKQNEELQAKLAAAEKKVADYDLMCKVLFSILENASYHIKEDNEIIISVDGTSRIKMPDKDITQIKSIIDALVKEKAGVLKNYNAMDIQTCIKNMFDNYSIPIKMLGNIKENNNERYLVCI